ncbi:MAG: hypothetical protein D6815_07685 [Candidatus Dadabacteria bacterium]|nr:MAG: hypothetical protein D6815_07685 [Candidatus Dadabacteria bacterium]
MNARDVDAQVRAAAFRPRRFRRSHLWYSSDLTIEIRTDVLGEKDGPMLEHGLQQVHGTRIIVPRSEALRPAREFLEERYELFRR